MNKDASGNVTVSIDGKNKTSEVKDGKAIVNISDLNAGKKEVTAVYSGDNVYNSNMSSTSFNIAKANTAFVIKAKMDFEDADLEALGLNFKNEQDARYLINYDSREVAITCGYQGQYLLSQMGLKD